MRGDVDKASQIEFSKECVERTERTTLIVRVPYRGASNAVSSARRERNAHDQSRALREAAAPTAPGPPDRTVVSWNRSCRTQWPFDRWQ